MLKGLPASAGIAIGKVYWRESADILNYDIREKTKDPRKELDKFQKAVDICGEELLEVKKILSENTNEKEAAIIDIQLLFLEDPMIADEVKNLIVNESYTVKSALAIVVKTRAREFEEIEDEYFRGRLADLLDLAARLMSVLDEEKISPWANPKTSYILAAKELLPSQTAKLDKKYIKGVITAKGGMNSHAAILARAIGIPAVMGIKELGKDIDGKKVILDGGTGEVFLSLKDELLLNYETKIEEEKKAQKARQAFAGRRAKTSDGVEINVLANINEPEEMDTALSAGADGVGLFRTEFIYFNCRGGVTPPLEEQVELYREAIDKFYPKVVTFRTLDIGADKPLKRYEFKEENPALGLRGIRWSLNFKEIFITQLKALLIASYEKEIKIMFPMVSLPEEIDIIKNMLKEITDDFKRESVKFNDKPQIGIMIEVPSISIMTDIIAEELDFFSIGSNDLTQYALAVDRANEKVQFLNKTQHPSVLRFLDIISKNLKKGKKELSICGEAAADFAMIPILIGLGFRNLSVGVSGILAVKEFICGLSCEECASLARKVLAFRTYKKVDDEVKEFLKGRKVNKKLTKS